MKKITIITDFETQPFKARILVFLKRCLNLLRLRLPPKNKIKYGGHFAVTRSLLDGLNSINQEFIYNPKKDAQFTEYCVVLSDYNALAKAIDMKRKGRIKVLLAGPNLFVLPTDSKGLISEPEIDYCLVPSVWVLNKYIQTEPKLTSRIKIWPAGVDLLDWPMNHINHNHLRKVLLYIKSPSLMSNAQKYESMLRSNLVTVVKIIYGEYTSAEYKKMLSDVDLCIFFSTAESQGIALLESWASNVPTWVWEGGFWTSTRGDVYPSSAAPYLNELTGNSFSSAEEFSDLLNSWEHLSKKYSSRAWVRKNMTDQICAQNLLNILIS
jgi:hypothetical protein